MPQTERAEAAMAMHHLLADGWVAQIIQFQSSVVATDAELTVRAVRIACANMTAPAMAPFQVSEGRARRRSDHR